ncbi:hypothetical protein NCCP2716_23480 [Sporosarcina sp. NCCP-2716]|uniref:hypothetical protein n=1 Tax=Sporosarcina sp. NCCP-2716 TaxID=2943679 RepID=UPI00203B3912|nr:hypothetical protein [Sporosarcina sp. NCCP-2716]GKV69850.1 hypothetical protein NCCP2716_23480 [Sporosarcina sp. NCCP-2716]
MKFVVLEDFKERFDHNRIYEKDGEYPVGGFEPTEERIKELSTKKNDYGRPFIKALKADKKNAQKPEGEEGDGKVDEKDDRG